MVEMIFIRAELSQIVSYRFPVAGFLDSGNS